MDESRAGGGQELTMIDIQAECATIGDVRIALQSALFALDNRCEDALNHAIDAAGLLGNFYCQCDNWHHHTAPSGYSICDARSLDGCSF
jgi:hypothetical protein